MTNEIKVIEDEVKAEEYILQQSNAEGYIVWYSPNPPGGPHMWTLVWPGMEQPGERDPYKCPSPLFMTREKAIEGATKSLPQGGICKVVRIVF